MHERLGSEVLHKAGYINTLTFIRYNVHYVSHLHYSLF